MPLDDGRTLRLNLREKVALPFLLLGRHPYEEVDSALVSDLIGRGDVVFDIGANLGWYSTLFSDLVGSEGRVFAFEPGIQAAEMLRANASLGYGNIDVIDLALGEREGEAFISVPDDLGNAYVSTARCMRDSAPIRLTTVDSFVRKTGSFPSFIKCDVEGFELPVLRGARETLASANPPALMVEINSDACHRSGYEPHEIVDIFRQYGTYDAYLIPLEMGSLQPIPATTGGVRNALFLPKWLEPRLRHSRWLSGRSS